MALSLVPDLDAGVGVALGNMGRYHNNFASSPAFGTLVALLAGALAMLFRGAQGPRVFALTLVCYQTHILMDYLTVGRGLMLLWPLSSERFQPPLHLFYGLHWSDGLVSWRHLVTGASEILFAVVLFGALAVARSKLRKDAPEPEASR